MALSFDVDLVNERAGCIESEHIAVFGVLDDGLGDAVCRKDHGLRRRWDLVQLVHKNGTFCPESINYKAVMNDLVPHVDGSAILGQGQLDDLDGAINPGAKTARGGQQHFEAWGCG